MTKIVFTLAVLFAGAAANAQTIPNYFNLTDAQINSRYNPGRTAYGIAVYVQERGAFQNAMASYFLVTNTQASQSFQVVALNRIQEGIWWETTLAKRRTIYSLQFLQSQGGISLSRCTIRFHREESQASSSPVTVVAGSLVCVKESAY